jgi:ribosomal protein S27AE
MIENSKCPKCGEGVMKPEPSEKPEPPKRLQCSNPKCGFEGDAPVGKQ